MKILTLATCLLLLGCSGASNDTGEPEDLSDAVRQPLEEAAAVEEQLEQKRQELDRAIEAASDP